MFVTQTHASLLDEIARYKDELLNKDDVIEDLKMCLLRKDVEVKRMQQQKREEKKI